MHAYWCLWYLEFLFGFFFLFPSWNNFLFLGFFLKIEWWGDNLFLKLCIDKWNFTKTVFLSDTYKYIFILINFFKLFQMNIKCWTENQEWGDQSWYSATRKEIILFQSIILLLLLLLLFFFFFFLNGKEHNWKSNASNLFWSNFFLEIPRMYHNLRKKIVKIIQPVHLYFFF